MGDFLERKYKLKDKKIYLFVKIEGSAKGFTGPVVSELDSRYLYLEGPISFKNALKINKITLELEGLKGLESFELMVDQKKLLQQNQENPGNIEETTQNIPFLVTFCPIKSGESVQGKEQFREIFKKSLMFSKVRK